MSDITNITKLDDIKLILENEPTIDKTTKSECLVAYIIDLFKAENKELKCDIVINNHNFGPIQDFTYMQKDKIMSVSFAFNSECINSKILKLLYSKLKNKYSMSVIKSSNLYIFSSI